MTHWTKPTTRARVRRAFAADAAPLTVEDVHELTGLPRKHISAILCQLRASGELRQIGCVPQERGRWPYLYVRSDGACNPAPDAVE